jgi:hypothetical protein
MITKAKILFSILALFLVMSCYNSGDGVDPKKADAQAANVSRTADNGRAPCPDCNQPCTTTFTGTLPNGEEYTYQAPCGTDDGGPGVGDIPHPQPPTQYPATPTTFCAAPSYPVNPADGKVLKIAATGCQSPIYYFSCIAGGWVVPASSVAGNPPTSGLFNGMHYVSDYTNAGGIEYVFLINFAGYSSGWYYFITWASSTACPM